MKSTRVDKIKKLIEEYREAYTAPCDQFKMQMLAIDLSYYRSSAEYAKACAKAGKIEDLCADDDKDAKVTPPLVLSQTQVILSYLAATLLDIYEPYPISYPPNLASEGKAIEAFLRSSSDVSGTYLNSVQELLNVVKHNIGFHKVSWRTANVVQEGTRTFALKEEGVKIESLSGYFCVWDTDTEPKDFSTQGMYFEHSKLMSLRKARHYLQGVLVDDEAYLKGGKEVVNSLEADTSYGGIVKALNTLASVGNGITNDVSGAQYSDLLKTVEGGVSGGTAVKITEINVRATATDVGAKATVVGGTGTSPALRGRYNLYRIIELNDVPVYIKELNTPYMEFGVTVGSVDDHGWSTRSIVEPLIMYQGIAAKLLSSKVETLKRSIGDRAIYHPLYIDPEALKNAGSDSKIPIRKNKWLDSEAIAKAYKRIPFEDHTADTAIPDADFFINRMANDATGVSAFRRGPVRGQRSVAQAQYELQAADGRGALVATAVEASRGTHIRAMVMVFLKVYKPGDLDWSKISENLSFRIVSKLRKQELTDDMGFVQSILGAASADPRIADIGYQILRYMVAQNTTLTLEDFKTQEQAQAQEQEQGLGAPDDAAGVQGAGAAEQIITDGGNTDGGNTGL